MTDYFEFFAPADVTIMTLREKFPEHFYNQDWYLYEPFANRPLDGKMHRISINVLEEERGREHWIADCNGHKLPSAGIATMAFFAYWVQERKRLWACDYTWTSDVDSHGDPVYVGGYGLNKPGFEIHRHLSLRYCHSVAPLV